MRISFIRHGRLDSTIEPMTIISFREWMKQYDLGTTVKETPIPIETIEMIESAKLVVTSDQRRAAQSTAELTDSLSFVQNPLLGKLKFQRVFMLQNG